MTLFEQCHYFTPSFSSLLMDSLVLRFRTGNSFKNPYILGYSSCPQTVPELQLNVKYLIYLCIFNARITTI